jgi:soluble lytic murein transglycosylase-like protein
MARARKQHYRIILIAVAAALIIAAIAVGLYRRAHPTTRPQTAARAAAPAAPPELAKFAAPFNAGADALGRGDGQAAIKHLSGFSFGSRGAEEYRLYYLATAHQLVGNRNEARRHLARLWRRKPRLVYRNDVAFNIGSLYRDNGSFSEAANVFGTLANRSTTPAISGEARWNYVESRLLGGDPAAALYAARNIAIQNPKSPHAAEAIALIKSLMGLPVTAALPLTAAERVERAENLLRDGAPAEAVGELAQFNAATLDSPWRQRVLLTRGLAYVPLLTDQYKFAIPAARASSRNNAVLASAINPISYKTVKEKKKVGTVKVRTKKKKTVTRPKYQTVFKKVKMVDLQLTLKKDEYDRKRVERLKDLLDMQTDRETRRQALIALIAIAEAKNQDAYLRQLVPELVKLDRLSDAALQRFWDKAWAAYITRDNKTARELFAFIRDTYTNPNVRRQSTYWLARIAERTGDKEGAGKVYRELANGDYEDLYGRFAERRGAKRTRGNTVKLSASPSWSDVAEKNMPDELRLAYELVALNVLRDARSELQDNSNDLNRKWADALLAQMLYQQGQTHVAYRYMRRAFPEIATIEQSSVPREFVEMYYPLSHTQKIFEEAKQHNLDPYLVMALIRQESAYDPQIKSPVGATGMMQIMPATGKELAAKLGKSWSPGKLSDPEYNIELGTLYLRQLINRFGGSTELALAAYNGGMGNVWKWQKAFGGRANDEFLESIPFTETRGYVKRITLMRSTYEQMHEELD